MPLDNIDLFQRPHRFAGKTCGAGRKGQGGFTLLEILIALSIFSVVLSILYMAYTGTFRNMDETQSQAEIYQMARIALERISEDLESAYATPWTEETGSEQNPRPPASFLAEPGHIDDRSADSLRFLSRAHLVFDQGDLDGTVARIAYEVKQSEVDGESLLLYRADTPAFEEEAPEEGGGLLLCDGLSGVDFTFYDEEGRAYDRWDSGSEEFAGRLPVMVSVVLDFLNEKDPEAPLRFRTGVLLPMAPGGI